MSLILVRECVIWEIFDLMCVYHGNLISISESQILPRNHGTGSRNILHRRRWGRTAVLSKSERARRSHQRLAFRLLSAPSVPLEVFPRDTHQLHLSRSRLQKRPKGTSGCLFALADRRHQVELHLLLRHHVAQKIA
jgi:hypothetical protein